MLSQVRGALKGAVAWVFVILLIAAFSLFGLPSITTMFSNSAVKVGGESFSKTYVSREFDTMFQRAARESGGGLTREDAIASGMHQQAVDRIVTQSVLDQYAEKMNLAIPREAISAYLRDNEAFQNPATGKFDQPTLESILAANNLSVRQFEGMIRLDLQRGQLIDSLVTSAPAPAGYMEPMILREVERRRVAYLVVTNEIAGEAAEPAPEDLKAFYDENPSFFTAPEYRTFDLLLLRSEDFRDGLSLPEEEIRRLYDAGKDRTYTTPERRTVYQLTYQTEAEALAAAADLEQGKPFENLAAQRGVTLAAATNTDATKSSILDPSVGDAAFETGLAPGAVIGPVRSLFGWTVLQLADIKPEETRSFEEVRPEIESAFLDNDVRRRMQATIDEIEEVRDTGAELSEAAEAAGLKVETVGPIDRVSFAPGGAIIDKVPGEAIAEAFVLDEGEQSEAMRLAVGDGYFFVSLREITPPALKPYDEVADQVEARWRNKERSDRIAKTVADIRAAVEGGQTLDAVARSYERAPTEVIVDRRYEDSAISRELNDKIFFTGLNELVAAPAGASGAQIIAEIREIGFGRSQITPVEQERFAQLVGRQLDQELAEAFIVSIRDDYGVKVDRAQIDAMFADGF